METIIKATPLADLRIEILTSSGISGTFDVKPYMDGSAFKELADEAYFRRVTPAHHGIRWPNDQDFSSDTIISDIQNEYGQGSGRPERPILTKPGVKARTECATDLWVDVMCRDGMEA